MGNLFGGRGSSPKGRMLNQVAKTAAESKTMKHTGIDPNKKPVAGSTGARLGDGYAGGYRDNKPKGRGARRKTGPVRSPVGY